MHLGLPHGTTAALLVGLAVWLAGLTGAIMLRNHLARNGKKGVWIPLAAYLVLSALALVVAGVVHHRHVSVWTGVKDTTTGLVGGAGKAVGGASGAVLGGVSGLFKGAAKGARRGAKAGSDFAKKAMPDSAPAGGFDDGSDDSTNFDFPPE
jgi:hypothetical protein